MDDLKILTLNTWGLLYISKDINVRMIALANALAQSSYDIVGLQEVWSENHFKLIQDKVKDVLPYSHRFVCGFLGTGCVTFSKYPIMDTVFHKYLFNGYFWDVFHGDWYGGKGLTGCVIKHPKKNIHFFNTHVHADYNHEGAGSFKECRTLQTYQVIQFLKHCTRPNDAIIMVGDFNHEPHEHGIVALNQLMSLRDTYEIAQDKPAACYTVDSTFNCDYNNPKETPKRIDYVFVNDYFECSSCDLAMQMIPGTNLHYSDHEGYEVKLKFKHEKESVSHQRMESKDGQEMLKTMLEVVKNGQLLSKKMCFIKTSSFLILFLLCLLLPILGFADTSMLQSLFGRVFFVFQISLSVICMVYVWMGTVLRKQEENSFKNIVSEIELKLEYLNHSYGKMTFEECREE